MQGERGGQLEIRPEFGEIRYAMRIGQCRDYPQLVDEFWLTGDQLTWCTSWLPSTNSPARWGWVGAGAHR